MISYFLSVSFLLPLTLNLSELISWSCDYSGLLLFPHSIPLPELWSKFFLSSFFLFLFFKCSFQKLFFLLFSFLPHGIWRVNKIRQYNMKFTSLYASEEIDIFRKNSQVWNGRLSLINIMKVLNQGYLEMKELTLRCEVLTLKTTITIHMDDCEYFQLCFLLLDSYLNLQRPKYWDFRFFTVSFHTFTLLLYYYSFMFRNGLVMYSFFLYDFKWICQHNS